MSTEIVWLRIIAPVPTATLAKLLEIAPEPTSFRHGGRIDLNGQIQNIVEFVTVAQATTEESSAVREEVQS